MCFNIAAITFSLILSVFLATYVARSLIFIFIARNIIKTLFPSNAFQGQSEVTISSGSSLNSAIAFLDNYDKDSTNMNTNLGTQLGIESCRASNGQLKKVDNEPFVSILIATYNEQQVINNLMKSCTALKYSQDKFEVIVIDDSEDETFHILKTWKKKIQNLKVIHRNNRRGWKGGALNVAVNNMSMKSSYALIVDADNVLASYTLKSFVSCFNECNLKENAVEVIQGYPISRVVYNNDHNKFKSNIFVRDYSNWIANATDFRLAKRNLIEFVAKDKLNLPVQITGSLFMVRSEAIKSLGFSEDLTEDWNLTLDLYFSPNRIRSRIHHSNHKYEQQNNNIRTRKVLFDPSLISYSCNITKFNTYFNQRRRVSEGHTRGFRKNILNILTSTIRLRDKIEFFLTGLQYSKFIAIVILIIIDFILLYSNGIDFIMDDNLMKLSISIQTAILLVTIGMNFMALNVCATVRRYNVRDVLYLLFLNSCTIPAFVIGSLCGLFKDKGIFYKTERNID